MSVLLGIISLLFQFMIGSFLCVGLSILMLVFMIYGIYKAVKGEKK